jgi:hypothetical protein
VHYYCTVEPDHHHHSEKGQRRKDPYYLGVYPRTTSSQWRYCTIYRFTPGSSCGHTLACLLGHVYSRPEHIQTGTSIAPTRLSAEQLSISSSILVSIHPTPYYLIRNDTTLQFSWKDPDQISINPNISPGRVHVKLAETCAQRVKHAGVLTKPNPVVPQRHQTCWNNRRGQE